VTSSATVLEKRCAGSERQRHLCRQQDACAHQHDAERIEGWYFEHFGSAHSKNYALLLPAVLLPKIRQVDRGGDIGGWGLRGQPNAERQVSGGRVPYGLPNGRSVDVPACHTQ